MKLNVSACCDFFSSICEDDFPLIDSLIVCPISYELPTFTRSSATTPVDVLTKAVES
jgi:hypothetical protein